VSAPSASRRWVICRLSCWLASVARASASWAWSAASVSQAVVTSATSDRRVLRWACSVLR
jgi:hypothetical protein